EPTTGLSALGAILDAGRWDATMTDATAPVVAAVDWGRFVPAYTAERPSQLLAELPEAAAPSGAPVRTRPRPERRERPRVACGRAWTACGRRTAERRCSASCARKWR